MAFPGDGDRDRLRDDCPVGSGLAMYPAKNEQQAGRVDRSGHGERCFSPSREKMNDHP
jgi:hypothetical protein